MFSFSFRPGMVLFTSGSVHALTFLLWSFSIDGWKTCSSRSRWPLLAACSSVSPDVSAVLSPAMGGRGKSGKGKQAPRLDVVKEWEHLGKKLLKPYPDGEGLCIKTGGIAVGKFFAPESLQSALTADNCELLARPVMGVNLLAAAAESALPALQAASDEPGKGGLADAKRCLEKLAAHLPAM